MKLLMKDLLLLLLIPGLLLVYLPIRLAGEGANVDFASLTVWQLLGLMLLPLGAGIGLWCVWVFAVYGHGTPIPLDPPRRLVVHGLYRHVRNPMGMGVLLAVAGWALLFQSWTVLLYGVGLGIFLHLFIVLIEEPTLRRSFGDDYVQYCRQVHRWLPR